MYINILVLVSWCLLNLFVMQIDYQYLSQISKLENHKLSLNGVFKHNDGSKCLSESRYFCLTIPVYVGRCCLIILQWSVMAQCTLAHQASLSEPLEIEEPKEPTHAPFDWSHAALEPFRDMLLLAQQRGIFSPQSGLPL